MSGRSIFSLKVQPFRASSVQVVGDKQAITKNIEEGGRTIDEGTSSNDHLCSEALILILDDFKAGERKHLEGCKSIINRHFKVPAHLPKSEQSAALKLIP